jgi:hypothetical protein
MWKQRLVEYRAAKARHDAAMRLLQLSERGVEDERAYTLAGLRLADERSVRACQEEMRAFERLRSALRCEGTATHLLACGALLDVPRAANDIKAI